MKTGTVNFTIGEAMGQRLTDIAREHVQQLNIEQGINTITQSLHCPIEVAHSVIKGTHKFAANTETQELFLVEDGTWNLLTYVTEKYTNKYLSELVFNLRNQFDEIETFLISDIRDAEKIKELFDFAQKLYPDNKILQPKILFMEKVISVLNDINRFGADHDDYQYDFRMLIKCAVMALPSKEVQTGYIFPDGTVYGSMIKSSALEHLEIIDCLVYMYGKTEQSILDKAVTVRSYNCISIPFRGGYVLTPAQVEVLKIIGRKHGYIIGNDLYSKRIGYDELKYMNNKEIIEKING